MSVPRHDSTCYHCGAECPNDKIRADEHLFCCQGCLGVYELLRLHDACVYYDVEKHPGQRPDGLPEARFDGLDAAAGLSVHDTAPGRSTFNVQLPDMHCASCVWLLERLSRFDAGIISSRVDILSRDLTVDYRTGQTTPSKIAMLLTSLGYPPVIVTDTDRKDGQRRSRRRLTTQLGVAGFAAGNVMMIGLSKYVAGPGGLSPDVDLTLRVIEIALSLPVLFFCAQPWLRSAFGSLRNGVVNLDVPVSLGILTIFLRSMVDILVFHSEGFLDSFTGLVFFLLIGRLFQQRAFEALEFDRSMRSFFPLSATVLRSGRKQEVAVEELCVGDTIVVRSSEVIPADAVLLRAGAVVDYAYLTGESEPLECAPGAMLFAGGRIMGRSAELNVIKPSTSSYMASLWSRQDIHTQRRSLSWTSERFGLAFTASVLAVAVVAALAWLPDVGMSLSVFSSVLIIACPCALTLAMPITFGTAMTMLSRRGIFLKNVAALGELQRVTHVVFDKTGTLTSPEQAEYVGEHLAPSLRMAFSSMARHSTHPMSQAIARQSPWTDVPIANVEEIPGMGLTCLLGDRKLALGSVGLAEVPMTDVTMDVNRSGAMAIIDGRAVGRFVMRHTLRGGAREMIQRLGRRSISTSVISGDGPDSGTVLEGVFGAGDLHMSATPEQKVEYVNHVQRRGGHVLMVGDGLNDIAAMSAANVSVAVSNGSSRIVPACDVMIDADRIGELDHLLQYAKDQHRVVGMAFWFTMIYNALGFTLACSGYLSPVITAIMMPLSSLLVIAISVGGARWSYRRTSWE